MFIGTIRGSTIALYGQNADFGKSKHPMCEYVTIKDLQKLYTSSRREDFYKQGVETSDFLGNKQL